MKLIQNIRPLQQFMEDGSFLMPEVPAVFRAAQALSAPDYMDYDYVYSVSGMAVRLSWQPGWAAYEGIPNQADVFFDGHSLSSVKLALERLGISYTLKYAADTGRENAEKEIKESIDRGMPVLMEGPHVFTTVLGYENGDLFGVGTFAPQNEREQPYQYNRLRGWQKEIRAYILISSFSPRQMDQSLLHDTLRTAVKLARTEKVLGAVTGIASFDGVAEMMVWDESFEVFEGKENDTYDGEIPFPYDRPEGYWRRDGAKSLGSRFWAGYCDFLCMLNGYCNFSRFLEKYAHTVPKWSDVLREAAKYYNRACDYSGELWQYVSPDAAGVRKFQNKEVRYAFAAHMLRAKIYTVKAVELLEKIL